MSAVEILGLTRTATIELVGPADDIESVIQAMYHELFRLAVNRAEEKAKGTYMIPEHRVEGVITIKQSV